MKPSAYFGCFILAGLALLCALSGCTKPLRDSRAEVTTSGPLLAESAHASKAEAPSLSATIAPTTVASQTTAAEERTLGPLDANKSITYFIASGEPSAGYRGSDPELARWALEAWEREGKGAFHFMASPEATALVRIYWVPAGSGEYGEMRRLVVDGRRGAEVFIRPDTDALGEQVALHARTDDLLRETIVYLTCVHELGHALGLQHTAEFRDVMYAFGYGGDVVQFFERYRQRLQGRADIATQAGVSAGDLDQLHALYAQ